MANRSRTALVKRPRSVGHPQTALIITSCYPCQRLITIRVGRDQEGRRTGELQAGGECICVEGDGNETCTTTEALTRMRSTFAECAASTRWDVSKR